MTTTQYPTSTQPNAGYPDKIRPDLADEKGNPTREGWQAIAKNFAVPFAHKTLAATAKRPALNYITARQVAERLDKVVGLNNWHTYFRVMDADTNAVECTLVVFGVYKADVGYPNSPDQPERESEPLKAAYSDAFKRAAVMWGCGRYLYGE